MMKVDLYFTIVLYNILNILCNTQVSPFPLTYIRDNLFLGYLVRRLIDKE